MTAGDFNAKDLNTKSRSLDDRRLARFKHERARTDEPPAPFCRKPKRLGSGALFHDLVRDGTRHPIAMMELHGEGRAALRHAAQVRDVAEHLLQRHMPPHDHGGAGTLLVLDLPAA